ncbi:MAG: 2Fe-2S iron-sulfur cluster-binding protein [Dehalococcoidia bacterium]|nr:2Fe-2S iron-sulfur cluster-binding protein [Dehalococcoidia bacterium]
METSITLEIDGKEVKAKEGITILEAAREANIDIPTLCQHQKLAPYGACRICSVEVEKAGSSKVVVACGYPVEEGIKVKTRSPRIDKIRKVILELIAPVLSNEGMGTINVLAREYKADVARFMPRFRAKPTRCILCGQCVRYCSEIVLRNAIGFVGRGIGRRVVFFPERASGYCSTCQQCFSVCPTGKIGSETTGDVFSGFSIDDYLSGEMS